MWLEILGQEIKCTGLSHDLQTHAPLRRKHTHTHTIMPGLIQGALEGRLRQLFVSGALTPGPLLTCSPTSPHLLPWLVPYCLFLSSHLQGLH
jgi:hypothetical protein